jgi:serine/threonine protein kinase
VGYGSPASESGARRIEPLTWRVDQIDRRRTSAVERRETSVLRRAGTADRAKTRDNAIIGRTIGNLRIVSVIGEGGMGVVYLAQHVGLPKQFAVKSLSSALSGDPDFRQRFFEEARKQAALSDPNIVQVTDFFEETGEFFLVMEYVDGQDLSHLIQSRGRLPESEALGILRDVLGGLGYAHSQGVVHRDLKPSNVLVDKKGRARIMDFGISIMAGGAEKSLTATGTTIGSPWYMSPEQILHPHLVDQRADIYALGIVLYEMLTSGVPFDGQTDFVVKDLQLRAPVPDPREVNPKVSEAVAQIVLKAMAKDPADRFQSCAELLAAIDAIQRSSDKTRRAVIVALVAATVASAGIIAYLVIHPVSSPGEDAEELERQRIAVQRQSAYNVIQTGSEKAAFTCTQLQLRARKQDGLKVAQNIQDPNSEAGFRTQIEEHSKNIDRALKEYATFLNQLGPLDASIVTEEFDRYTRFLESRKSLQQIQIARTMKGHYEARRHGGGKVDERVMRSDCEAAIGRGA